MKENVGLEFDDWFKEEGFYEEMFFVVIKCVFVC